MSLTGRAPASGVTVALASSNSAVQVPSSVAVAGGASSASFTVNTSTVTASTPATITASYAGLTRSTSLTVLPPPLEASFTVSSPQKGADACVLGPATDEVDCIVDGGASRGFVHQWMWTYWTAGAPLGHTIEEARSSPKIANQCAFFEGARGGDNPDGSRYIQMTIELVVQDRVGVRSSAVRRAVKLYPNRLCGFSY